MSYRGDIRLGDTIDIKFTTRRFTTGAPFTLAGSPAVAAYVGNSTTEITAGITLSVDFDSRTGLNNVRVVATSGNGYATGTNVDLVITAGTVDSVSVVGEVVGSFSIENRAAYLLLGTPAGASVSADLADIEGKVDDLESRLGTPSNLGSGATVAANLVDIESHTDDIAAILALLDDARTEPGQGAPPVNPDLATKIDYLYKAWRNKKDNGGGVLKLYADDGTTVDQKCTITDDGTTFTAGEMATGP